MPKSAPKPAATPKAETKDRPKDSSGKVTTDISVDLVVNTEDQLRRIEFGLDKSTDDGGQPKWTIHFKLFQRTETATPFGEARVSLDVVVDKNLHDKAAETATKGLSAAQTAYLAGPAAKAAVDSAKPGGKPADQKVQSALTK